MARRNAIERGVPTGHTPLGYRKLGKHQGWAVDKREAAKVRDMFERRAAGESYGSIGRRHELAASSVRQILAREAYLGVARSGQNRNEHAHPPIVSRELFEQANAARTSRPVPAGKTTRDRWLVGLVRCASCGCTMKAIRDTRKGVASYYCKQHSCGERAFVQADVIEAFVADWFTEALRNAPRLVDVVGQAEELEEAHAEREQAEAELVAFVETASALDMKLFQRGLAAREERADQARARVHELSARTAIPAGSLLSLWEGFAPAERRDVLRGFLDRIEVRKGATRGLAGNLRIVWSDGSVADVADEEPHAGAAAA